MEISLYLADARNLSDHQADCMPLLTAKRRAEAESFLEEKDRLLHCAAGLLLRSVLHVTTDDDLTYNGFGKPELTQRSMPFSLSHAGNYAVLAVGKHPVGVDIEPIITPQVLPRKVLRQDELNWLLSNPTPENFCFLWTRLESALKASGCGLAVEERDFSLLENGRPWHWSSIIHDGHFITCAGEEPITVHRIMMQAEQLL